MSDDLTADLFHCCALTAFVAEARSAGGWPDSELTRRRAYVLYERELAARNAKKDLLSGRTGAISGVVNNRGRNLCRMRQQTLTLPHFRQSRKWNWPMCFTMPRWRKSKLLSRFPAMSRLTRFSAEWTALIPEK